MATLSVLCQLSLALFPSHMSHVIGEIGRLVCQASRRSMHPSQRLRCMPLCRSARTEDLAVAWTNHGRTGSKARSPLNVIARRVFSRAGILTPQLTSAHCESPECMDPVVHTRAFLCAAAVRFTTAEVSPQSLHHIIHIERIPFLSP